MSCLRFWTVLRFNFNLNYYTIPFTVRHRYSHGACEDLVLTVPRFVLVTPRFKASTQQGDGRRFDLRTTSIVTSRLCTVFPLADSWTSAPIEIVSSVFASGSHRTPRNGIANRILLVTSSILLKDRANYHRGEAADMSTTH